MIPSKQLHNHSTSEDANSKLCIGCKELIKYGATVCPYCHTTQSPSRWKIVGNALKWIGGITAIITLVAGTLQISSLYQNWRERQGAVEELVRAAEIQSDSEDYQGAWELIEEALILEPASQIARDKQVQLAMLWLRAIPPNTNQQVSEKINLILPTLYRGVAKSDKTIAADASAHIGWADQFRYREGRSSSNIESHFRRSLEIDSENVYAHAMWAYWILSPEANYKYGADRLELSQIHFLRALNTGKETDYVRDLQIRAILHTDALEFYDREVEAIRLANEVRKNKQHLGLWLRFDLVGPYRSLIVMSDWGIMTSEKLLSVMSPEDLLDTFVWLSEDIDYVNLQPNYFTLLTYKFIIARLTEEMGETEKALSQYQAIQSKIESGSQQFGFHREINEAIVSRIDKMKE